MSSTYIRKIAISFFHKPSSFQALINKFLPPIETRAALAAKKDHI